MPTMHEDIGVYEDADILISHRLPTKAGRVMRRLDGVPLANILGAMYCRSAAVHLACMGPRRGASMVTPMKALHSESVVAAIPSLPSLIAFSEGTYGIRRSSRWKRED